MEISLNIINTCILCILLINFLSSVNGQAAFKLEGGDEDVHITFCLNKNEPLRLGNPFQSVLASTDGFELFEWKWKKNKTSHDVVILTVMDSSGKGERQIPDNRFSQFEFWGLQIDKVKYTDSGIYTATILDTGSSGNRNLRAHVTISSPPELSSEKLSVTVKKNENGQRNVTCGRLSSLGVPPVELTLTHGNGSVLEGTYVDGSLSVLLDKEMDFKEIHCGLEDSIASQCIPPEDATKWDSSYDFGRSTASADTTGIIAGIAVSLVLLLVIIALILIIVKRKKKGKEEMKYDAKAEEAKVAESGLPMSSLMAHSDYNDDYQDYEEEGDGEDPYNRSVSSKPYVPSKAASPYMVTGLKMGGDNGDSRGNHYASTPTNRQTPNRNSRTPIYKQPPVVTPEGESDDDIVDSRSKGPPVAVRKDRNRNVNSAVSPDSRKSWAGVVDNFKEKTQQQQQQQQQPSSPNQPQPVALKRNKHFTRSSDGLNLVDGERGDLGGGGGENVGTLV